VATIEQVSKAAAEATSRAEQDLALWRAWKKSPTDANLSALLQQVGPLIQREVNRWAGSLARPVLEAEAKRLAVKAFETYDPTRGAALGTHVANMLLKLSRLSYSNQNVARLPENKLLQFHGYNLAHAQLSDELGRPPTTDELADHLAWSIPQLERFRRAISHQELLESGGAAPDGNSGGLFETDSQDHTVDFVHHDLAPMQKLIFEHLTGYGGAEVLSNQEIMKKLGLTQGRYSYLKGQMVTAVERATAGR
jgi:DNA-directed RNA polymerase specialized sigma subunit